MNPLRLLVLIVSLPLLLGGCGKKEVSTNKTKPKPEGVHREEELELRGSIWYLKGSDTPYTGKAYGLHENGQKLGEGGYKDGKQDGLWTEWHENGQKGSEGSWKDGKMDGVYRAWHENGLKKMEINWKDGKPNGLWVNWHSNGQKKDEANVKGGEPKELFLGWHENGQKKFEKKYKDGKRISEKWWNSKGEPVATAKEARK